MCCSGIGAQYSQVIAFGKQFYRILGTNDRQRAQQIAGIKHYFFHYKYQSRGMVSAGKGTTCTVSVEPFQLPILTATRSARRP